MSIVLDAVNKTLEIVLAGVVAANQLPFVASYADYDDAAPGFTPGENDGLTNNAVVVVLVAAPGAGEQRLVNNISVFNRDTAAADVTIQYDNAGVDREIVKVNLAVGYSLHFREDQWQVLDTNGAVRMVLDTGVALQHDILSNTHGDAAVDAVTRGSLIYGNATPEWDELVIGGATEYLKSDGVDASWAAVDFDDLSGDCDLADLAGYARGSIIRGGAADWEAHAAETNHFILVGDGVDVSSKAFDWDDMAAGAGADMVHSHQAAGEGGQIDHGLALTGLGDDDHTQYLLADGTRALSGPWAPGQIVTMINEGLHILDTDASHDLIIKAGSDLTADRILSLVTGDAARTITLAGNPTLDDWFDQSVKQAATPTFGGVSLPTATFNGASGANIITVPDNFADALHLSDAGGIEYVKIISTDTQPVVRFNDGGVDVDFEVEAVGVADALQVRGADGQITLGVLTAGWVRSGAGGILAAVNEIALTELGSWAEGRMIIGDVGDWATLVPPGAAGHALVSNAASFAWDQTPTWTGLHTFNAGVAIAAGQGITMADDTWIGIGAALERIVFDAAGDICVMGAKFGVGTLTPQASAELSAVAGTALIVRSSTEAVAGFARVILSTGAGADADTNQIADIRAVITQANPAALKSELQFRTNSGDNSTLRMVIDDVGSAVLGGAAAASARGVNKFLEIEDITAPGIVLDDTGGAGEFAIFSAGDILNFSNETTDWLKLAYATGHFYPGTNKAQDLGLTGSRWRTVYAANALNTGTSRLIESTRDCPACGQEMVRGTGGLCVVGEIADYMLAFCPVCGTAAMESIRHLPEAQMSKRKSPPKIELVGISVVPSSGLSRQIFVNFRYIDGGRGRLGDNGVTNSTILSESEIAVFFVLSPKDRKEFLLRLGEREWYASEEVRLMKETAAETQALFDVAISDWIGTDLMKETT